MTIMITMSPAMGMSPTMAVALVMMMTPFQWLTLGCLALILLGELWAFLVGRGSWRPALVRSSVWLAAAVSIARPDLLQAVANTLGIHSGANLVIYLLALTFFATAFFLYSRYVRLQRQVVALVREMAILEAQRPGNVRDTAV
jgi:hypothetical protein